MREITRAHLDSNH